MLSTIINFSRQATKYFPLTKKIGYYLLLSFYLFIYKVFGLRVMYKLLFNQEYLPTIGIIGCGTMGSAIAKGLAGKHPLVLYDIDPEKSKKLKDTLVEQLKNFDYSV